jgi:hypothetical protein
VSFLIFSIIYISYGMCRPQFRQATKGNCCVRAGKCLFSPRVWYTIAALAMLGGTGAALSLVTSFKNAVSAARARAPAGGRTGAGADAVNGRVCQSPHNHLAYPIRHTHAHAQTNDTTSTMTTFSDVIHLATTETNNVM